MTFIKCIIFNHILHTINKNEEFKLKKINFYKTNKQGKNIIKCNSAKNMNYNEKEK